MPLSKIVSRMLLSLAANICIMFLWVGSQIVQMPFMIVILLALTYVGVVAVNKSGGWFQIFILLLMGTMALQTFMLFLLIVGVDLKSISNISLVLVIALVIFSANPVTVKFRANIQR